MKKIIAMLLSLIMICGLATTAFADGEVDVPSESSKVYEDQSTVTFTKWYSNWNAGISPAETFTFIWAKAGVTDAGVDPDTGDVITLATMPDLISVAPVSFDEGDAGKAVYDSDTKTMTYHCKEDVVVTLPEYDAVGIYTYLINEVKPAVPTAGVTYHPYTIKLVVTVIEQEGKVRVAAVHTEVDTDGNDLPKDDMINNIYQSGSLAVTKEVIGNAGDKEKEFDVTVTFTAPANEAVKSTISYTEDGTAKTIAPTDWSDDNTASVVIKLKDAETITFTNIPADVTYTVEETSYAEEGYEDAVYDFSNEEKLIEEYPYGQQPEDDDNKDTVKITNEKNIDVDTGVALDSAPYFLMLAVAVVGMVALISKKRYEV